MTSPTADTRSALAGIRVVEFGPYVALPLTGRILGSLGAEVIKVETNKVLDEMSFIPAWSRGAQGSRSTSGASGGSRWTFGRKRGVT